MSVIRIFGKDNPVAFQKYGFTPKQVNAPKAVLFVPEKC